MTSRAVQELMELEQSVIKHEKEFNDMMSKNMQRGGDVIDQKLKKFEQEMIKERVEYNKKLNLAKKTYT
jgi:hypothetical protein